MSNERLPLSLEEMQNFRIYALENQTENDGSESQWADFTLRALDELDRLRNAAPRLFERVREIEAENARIWEQRQREQDQNIALRARIAVLERERDALREVMMNAATALQNGYRHVGVEILNRSLRFEEKAP